MTEASGAPPQGGWARMVVELHVNNLKTSLSFWQEILRFGIAFERSEELFAYLEHPEGHRVSGMVANEHEQREINPGDVVQIKAGERHWHGAKANSTMGHITITLVGGQATWG